ncbi:MAG: hypothetical protein DMD93_17945 [Candidatus Rokuibacteriota bacterium]|nr:MAG: hypothetical protein DMD93_17945 [Candidatus Rokubacteria bacterium]
MWASGAAYEPYVGRWSRLVAREFVEWLAIPPAARWLDVGCGTGALTETILRNANPAQIDGIDPSEGYLELARQQLHDPRVRFGVGDARHLSAESERYDAVVSALVRNRWPEKALHTEGIDGEHGIHGGRAFQGQGRRARLSPFSRARPYGA